MRFHRSDFLDVFVDHLPEGVACFGKRVVTYHVDNEVTVRFADGTSETCDILVGCDGVKSVVRKQLFEDLVSKGHKDDLCPFEPRFSGTIAYRGLIPAQSIPFNADGSVHNVLQRPTMVCYVLCAVLSFV